MERPILNPIFLDPDQPPRRPSLWRKLLVIPRLLAVILFMDLLFWRRSSFKVEEGSTLHRIARAVAYRLIFVPLSLVLLTIGLLAVLIYVGTHPPRLNVQSSPLAGGHFYDPVSFNAQDGVLLEGWLIHAVDARTILENKNKILNRKFPAVVLVHDQGWNRSQMLPLVQPLHKEGYTILLISLRSNSSAGAATTFGLREARDVEAAVELLRRRPGVDPHRIAVIGVGTGANASLLATLADCKIAALVLDRPITSSQDMVARNLLPRQPWLNWLMPISKWGFEMAYRVDADELDLHRHSEAMANLPILLFDDHAAPVTVFERRGLKQAITFLSKHLHDGDATAGISAAR